MQFEHLSDFLQVGLTLVILSFLYRDNPLYKFAEHLFVGIATGYYIVQQYQGTFLPNLWRPLTAGLAHPGQADPWTFALAVPFILGLMFFFKFQGRTAWIARWPMAVVIGTYAGIAIIGTLQGDLIEQLRANLLPWVKPGSWQAFLRAPGLFTFLEVLWNPILIVGVLTSLVYFFFSKPHTGVIGGTATIGIWFLMVSFGASYGNTVITRVALFFQRAFFLLAEQRLLTLVLAAALIVYLLFYRRHAAQHPEGEDLSSM